MKDLENLRVEKSPPGFSMEVEEKDSEVKQTLNHRLSGHSCPEFGEEKVERVRRSTYDEVSGEED